jgi:hypothetical protein
MPKLSSHVDSLPRPEELRAWVEPKSVPRVSLYLPLEQHARHHQQNLQMRDQAVRDIEKKLAALGIAAAPRLERLRAIEVEVRNLEPRTATLAVFADESAQRTLPLHAALPYAASVGNSFALRPLLGVLARSSRYRVLAVSERRVALFDGGNAGLAATPHAGIPASLEDALGSETTEKELRVRGTGATGGSPSSYSHGSASEERKLDRERFHTVLVAALGPVLGSDAIPLVVAGTDEHRTALREKLKLPSLLDEGIRGNVDALGPAELHERAWPLVEQWCSARAAGSTAYYERARNQGKGRDLVDDVAAAAIAGRVRRLWLDAERRIAGRIDPQTGRTLEGAGDDDVLDALAELVLARGGEVIPVPAAALPSASGLAAELH